MTYEFVASDAYASEFPRPSRHLSRAVPGAIVAALTALAGAWMIHRLPASAPEIVRAPTAATAAANPYGELFDPGFSRRAAAFPPPRRAAPTPAGAVNPYGALFDPGFSARPAQFSTAAISAPGENFQPAPSAPAPVSPPSSEPVRPATAAAASAPESVASATPQTIAPDVDSAPLPPPRPAEFAAAPTSPPGAARHVAQNGKGAQPTPVDNRNFFERLLGLGKPSAAPALSYAPSDGGLSRVAQTRVGQTSVAPTNLAQVNISSPSVRYDRYTAVYDLTAHVVYLPNGTRLEAHSGLGDRLDDPAHVNERGRGATPPHLYELTPREELFHGVQALRLTPIGGGDIFGRAGLLAHSFMLGPNGDSNGCVSFRDYEAFLQAYQNGQVKRLAVVARLD